METAKKIAVQRQYKVLAEKAIALLNEINLHVVATKTMTWYRGSRTRKDLEP
ncbi:MAG: hypothetical protein QNJ72_12620 [Pleurocapsa sp. MO_226.B13]|nr:hypothetical protein [Pleurocapsa sp. MO_226.B13]